MNETDIQRVKLSLLFFIFLNIRIDKSSDVRRLILMLQEKLPLKDVPASLNYFVRSFSYGYNDKEMLKRTFVRDWSIVEVRAYGYKTRAA